MIKISSNLWYVKLVVPLHKPLLMEVVQPLDVLQGDQVLLPPPWKERLRLKEETDIVVGKTSAKKTLPGNLRLGAEIHDEVDSKIKLRTVH